MRRIFCVLTSLITLLGVLGLFSGCQRDNEEEQEPMIPIIENGQSNYIIVYSSEPTAAETEAVSIVKEKIKQVTDVRIKSVSEEFADDEGTDLSRIYIGNTTFEPAVAAKERISEEHFDAYVIDRADSDIYVVGASETALINAANYFAENLIEKNYDAQTQTLLFEGFCFDGEIAFPTGFSAGNICEYSIVYDADALNMKAIANNLQQIIERNTGFSPDVYKDTEAKERTFEILIGETDRSLSKRCYENSSRIMEYEYVIESCKLQLAIGGCYSGQKCIDDFSYRFLRNKDEYIQSGNYYKTDFAQETQGLTVGSDVRIMSANVLAYRWGEAKNNNILPVAQRAEIFAGVLLNYLPDAVGVQETDQPWQQALPWYLERMKQKDGIEYTYMFDKLTHEEKTMINFSSIVYRSDMYNVDESGYKVFSIWDITPSYFQRVATYIKLTSKTDAEKKFVLVNTHWAHEDHATVNACAVEQAELVNTLKAKYEGVSVFCTGDYNNLETREWKDTYLNKLVNDINGSIASDVARQKGVLITPGGCRGAADKMSDNILRDVDNSFIDHIICSGGSCDIMRHDTIRANKCNVLSDHSPIYADIDLK
ncbi:MAG: hypothetical protein IJZ83_03485 [Clostridia bacterium]|nr:hypothetical protein [Clostridia bacterium]